MNAGQREIEPTPEARQAAMDREVARALADGWRLESRTDTQLVLVMGRRPNHLLHLVLTILTLGVWAIVWVLLATFGGERQRVVTFHPGGELTETRSQR